ncbi:MAG: hypothetical protein KC636_11825, partial [Myxococcales bacterium]|nr:hypothetical protein [Myxococcales bacterium]
RVLPCERYPESAAALGVPARSVEEALREAVALRRAPGAGDAAPPDLVVANPPRRGLGEEACALLLELGAPAIHVMSCSARALARDLDQLAAGYRLVRLRAFDTLPQTQHVELIAWLTRLDRPVY